MTSAVKSCEPLFQVFMMLFNRRALQEAEPVRDDGGSCGDPWVESHLTCVRRVPASREARGGVAASSRRRG